MSSNIAQSDVHDWPEPNFTNPPRRSWMMPYACTLQAISFATVMLRFWLRITQRAGTFGLDDALLIPALAASIAFTTFVLLSTEKFSSGMHIWDVPTTLYEPIAMAAWSSELTFLVSISCTKCSVLLFFRRLTKGTYDPKWKYTIIAAIVLIAVYSVVFVTMLVLICSPTEAYWKIFNPDLKDKKYTCHKVSGTNIVSGVMSILSDLYSVILPCMMLRCLHISRSQRIALNAIFGLGLFVAAAGSVRTYYHSQLQQSSDITWTGFDAFIWAELEVQLALICSAAPALRSFVRMYLKDPFTRLLEPIRTRSHSKQEHTTATSGRSLVSGTSLEILTLERSAT